MLYNTNTLLFKRYIKTEENFNLILDNVNDCIIKDILTYRFINGLTWEFTGYRVGYNNGDAPRITLTRYLRGK